MTKENFSNSSEYTGVFRWTNTSLWHILKCYQTMIRRHAKHSFLFTSQPIQSANQPSQWSYVIFVYLRCSDTKLHSDWMELLLVFASNLSYCFPSSKHDFLSAHSSCWLSSARLSSAPTVGFQFGFWHVGLWVIKMHIFTRTYVYAYVASHAHICMFICM